MNRKEKQAAICSALSSRVAESKIFVIDELKVDEIKTKKITKLLAGLNVEKALVVTGEKDEKVVLSARNIPAVRAIASNSINVYDILKYENLVISKDAVAKIEEVYA